MAIIKSVVKKTGAKGDFWIAVIEGEGEVMAFDSAVMNLEGKDCPHEIALTQTGKKYIKFPKQGGFKSGGGFQKGKSELEIKAQVLTMSMAYAKDVIVAQITASHEESFGSSPLISLYGDISKAILADLAKITPTEAPKTADKPPQSVPQETSPEKPKDVQPESDGKLTKPDTNLTIKEKLAKKMERYLQNLHSDTDENFQKLLIEITSFPDKDKETGKLTGKTKFCDSWDRLSDGWAKTAMGKLEKLIDEEERKAIAEDDSNPY